MLIRQNYYHDKSAQIKKRVLKVLVNLNSMTENYSLYLHDPSEENRKILLDAEKYVDKNEQKIEEYILEAISLQQLNLNEIKWLMGMSRINRELERIGDQITNLVTLSRVNDTTELKPLINSFFEYEQEMIARLIKGIEKEDLQALKYVIEHDHYVNKLNKGTYQDVADSINEKEPITESNLKMVIFSRFLERIGDHLVNIARIYKKQLDLKDRRKLEWN